MTNEVTGLFANIDGQTYDLQLRLFDSDGFGNGVWEASVQGDTRYIEAPVDVDLWKLVDSVVHCYEEADDYVDQGKPG